MSSEPYMVAEVSIVTGRLCLRFYWVPVFVYFTIVILVFIIKDFWFSKVWILDGIENISVFFINCARKNRVNMVTSYYINHLLKCVNSQVGIVHIESRCIDKKDSFDCVVF